MSSKALGLIELVLVFGSVLAFGVWQLWSLRRERLRDAQHDEQRDEQPDRQQDHQREPQAATAWGAASADQPAQSAQPAHPPEASSNRPI